MASQINFGPALVLQAQIRLVTEALMFTQLYYK